MAEIILFRPKAAQGEARAIRPRPPIGLLFVAAPLVRDNYRVKIIDAETNFYWLEELGRELDNSTICVGVSSMTGTQISGGLEFAKIVKERSGVPIVWGGLHASMLPEQTVKNNFVDIVVRGEGEDVFLKIVNALKNKESLKGIPNVWHKENGRVYSNPETQFIDLNSLPAILPYHLIDCEKYITVKRSSHPGCKRIFDLHTDRGCPHRCSFCYNLNINSGKWRYFNTARVMEQLGHLIDKFSVDGINFLGDNFFVDKKRVVDICTQIIKKRFKLSWHADCRIDYFSRYDDSFIDLLKQSGCEVLTFGIESGSPRILDLMHKDINLDQIFIVNEKLRKSRIEASYHFMAGFPEETKEDVIKTYALMVKLHERHPGATFLGPSIYTPYPGTPFYDKCLQMGFTPPGNLEDWSKFGWDEKTCLPFLTPSYSRWLCKSVNVIKSANTIKRIVGSSLTGLWFKFRAKMIINFNLIGPQPEDKLIRFAGIVTAFAKKILGAS